MHDLGGITVRALPDGVIHDTVAVFRGIPEEDARRLSGAGADGGIQLPVSCFLLRGPFGIAVVDAGAGDTMGPRLGHLPASLASAGVNPDRVGTVLLTHLHPDHSNGLLHPDGAPLFPAAAILVAEAEAQFWLDTPVSAAVPARFHRNLAAQQRALAPYAGRVRRVGPGEALPGLSALPCPGHTPGHTAWVIRGGRDTAIAWGDIVHAPAVQVPRPEAGVVFDGDAEAAAASRRAVFARVAAEGWLVAGAHLPGGFGRLAGGVGAYRMEPA